MPGEPAAPWQCPKCGHTEPLNDNLPENFFFRPWHIRGRGAAKAYVESLGEEAREWLLALYVDEYMQLLAVDTIARGSIANCPAPFNQIIVRAFQCGAKGYVLVHNHPSGDPTPSESDMRVTMQLARISADLETPLFDHLIVTRDGFVSCGYF